MKNLPLWFRAVVRVLGAVCPPAMTAIAWRLFWSLGKPMPLNSAALDLHQRATRTNLVSGGRQAVVYRWGSGPNVVLLVHGWRGRASQFAALIRALESPDRTIVAFDAPGNGDAPGTRTDVFDYVAVIKAIAGEAGTLEALVAHSFGAIAAFTAVRDGVTTRRLVSIAGVSRFDYVVSTFANALGLSAGVTRRLRSRIDRTIFRGEPGAWRRYRSELDPTDHTPLLVVQDRADRAVDFGESAEIAAAHLGPLTELYTSGLGHTRVLSDPAVIEAIVSFAGSGSRTRSAEASPGNR